MFIYKLYSLRRDLSTIKRKMVKIHKNTHRILYTKVGFVCILDIVLVCAKSSNLLRFSSARKGMGREHSLPDPRSYRRIEIFVCSCAVEG